MIHIIELEGKPVGAIKVDHEQSVVMIDRNFAYNAPADEKQAAEQGIKIARG